MVDRILGNVELSYKIAPWIDVLYRVGTDVSGDKRKQITSKRIITDIHNQNYGNRFAGSYAEGNINIRELTAIYLTTNHKVNSEFSIRALVGHKLERTTEAQNSTINDLVIAGLYNLGNTSGSPVDKIFC